MTFKRTTEDFKCEMCGHFVQGNGYTNHCPKCLWSKHVDNSPGDRANTCGGMMEPIGVEKKGGEYTIIHKCTVCGLKKPNKAVKEDDFQMIVQVSAESGK
jgi:hypothetical protein